MMKKLLTTIAAGSMLIATSCPTLAAEEESGPFAASNFSATLTLTTDYIFRGVSFTGEEPALQGSFDWGYNNVYAGVWGSSIKGEQGLPGDGYDQEFDYYAGYANSWNGIDFDLMAIYFNFPGANDDFGTLAFAGRSMGDLETDQFEMWLNLSHTFSGVPLEPTIGFMYAYSPDFTLEDGNGNYFKGSLALSLPAGFSLDGAVGHQDVEGDQATGSTGAFCDPAIGSVTNVAAGSLCDGYSYTHWEVGVGKDLKGFHFDLRYHDTNEDNEHIAFLGTKNIADSRVVFTISRSF